ncbi:MAG: hypothetical protein Q4C01_05445 [Clostridia bacterium]|nr:hypothetical protein [Clostridia bacterium]
MKKQTKRTILISVIAAVVVIVAILLIAALQQDGYGFNWFERNKKVAVAEDASLSMGEFERTFSNSAYYYSMYITDEESWTNLANSTLQQEIAYKIYVREAEALGLELTAEQQEAVDAAGQSAVDSLESSIRSSLASSYGYASGDEVPDTTVLTQLTSYFKDLGCSKAQFMKEAEYSTYAEYCYTNLVAYYEENEMVGYEELLTAYEQYVTDIVMPNYYNGTYASYETSYQAGTSEYRYLYIPEDFVFVRAIKLSDEETMNEVVARLEAGEDFETILKEDVNEDEFIKTMDDSEGYAIGEADCFMDSNDGIVYPIAAEMTIGEGWETVDVVATSTDDEGTVTETHTYYIIMRVDGETGIVPFEKYRDAIETDIELYYMSEQWLAEVEYPNSGLIDKLIANILADIGA